jgi:hypothetical protein
MSLLRISFLSIVLIAQNFYCQSSNIKALSKFERGVSEYNSQHYSLAKDFFISSRDVLGGSNLRIQYFLVQAFYKMEKYKRCRTELELYFDYYESRKEQTYFYVDSIPKRHITKRDQMIKILDRVDEKISQISKVKNYDIEMQESLRWIKSKIDEFGIHSNKYIYNTYEQINENSEIKSGGLEDVVAHGKVIRECLMTFDNNFNVTIKYEVKNSKLPVVYKFSAKDVKGAEMHLNTAEMEIAYLTSEEAIVEKSEADHYFLRITGFSGQTYKFCLNWDIVYSQCRIQSNFLDLMLTNDKDLTQRLINAFDHIGEMNKQKRLNNKPSEKF